MEIPDQARQQEENLFSERKAFIEAYFGKSETGMSELINTGLEDSEVEEIRDKQGKLEALLSYSIQTDPDEEKYCAIGIAVTHPDMRGEGLMDELLERVIEKAKRAGCAYATAKAYSDGGVRHLESHGFSLKDDEVTGAEHYFAEINEIEFDD